MDDVIVILVFWEPHVKKFKHVLIIVGLMEFVDMENVFV
jgi:hypothetical protein